jgi:CPA1 family monovalent cation:H+ antiporter
MGIELVTGRVLFLVVMALTGLLISRLFRLDLTLGALLSGILFGLIVMVSEFDTGIRAYNFMPLVFYVVLPILIFQAAWHIQQQILVHVLIPALILAIPGVLISCIVTAALVYIGIDHPAGFPWLAALLTGAILSATDPVSVVAKLRDLNAPKKLETLIEAESLLNDASAVVLFGIILSFAIGQVSTLNLGVGVDFTLKFIGGILTGAIVGLVASFISKYLGSAPAISIITIITALGSFYVAEHILHVSGIISVVVAALASRLLLRNSEFLGSATYTWEWLGLLFNALIFSLLGLVISHEMFIYNWLAMLITIGAMLVSRIISVGVSALLSRGFADPISLRWQGLLVWGGLRGAIAIALVLTLPVELPYWWTVQSMVFGAVLFSILVQGLSAGCLAKKLKIN